MAVFGGRDVEHALPEPGQGPGPRHRGPDGPGAEAGEIDPALDADLPSFLLVAGTAGTAHGFSMVGRELQLERGRPGCPSGTIVMLAWMRERHEMNRFWSSVVHTLTPYVPGEQPKLDNLVKLNTNENPYGPSPKVLEAIRDATQDTLRLYPDPNADLLGPPSPGITPPRASSPGRCSWATAPTRCWPRCSRPCSSTTGPAVPGHHLQLLSGLLRPLRHCLRSACPWTRASRSGPGLPAPQRRHHLPQPQRPHRPLADPGRDRGPARGPPRFAVVIDEAYADFGCESARG